MSNASTTGAVDPDWAKFDAMSDEERHRAALSDPDIPPITPEDAARMRRTPRVRIVRRAMGWSREQFSQAFRIPTSLLDEWESGRGNPDEAAAAYIEVIAACPDVVAEALGTMPVREKEQSFPTGPGSEYQALRQHGDRISREA